MEDIDKLARIDGFLHYKRNQSSNKWKRCWFVVNGTFLSYYKDFISLTDDDKLGKDVDLSRCLFLRYADNKKPFTFLISYKHTNKEKAFYFSANSEEMCNAWLTAVKVATQEWDLLKCCKMLNVNIHELESLVLSETDMIHAYRTKCHEQNCQKDQQNNTNFKLLQRAFRHISYYVKDPIHYKSKRNNFCVNVDNGIHGLGLHIGEINDKIVVIDILPYFDAKNIIPNTETLFIGDQLMAIDGVDITDMSLSKVLEIISKRIGKLIELSFCHLKRDSSSSDMELSSNIQSVQPFSMINAFSLTNPESEIDDFNAAISKPVTREKLGWFHLYRLIKLNSKEGDINLILDNMKTFVKSCPPNEKFEIPEEIDRFIESLKLPVTVEHTPAFQKAVKNVDAVDMSGMMLKKWELSGDSAAQKLSRFESRLSKVDIAESVKPSSRTSLQASSLSLSPKSSTVINTSTTLDAFKKKNALKNIVNQKKISILNQTPQDRQQRLQLQVLRNLKK